MTTTKIPLPRILDSHVHFWNYSADDSEFEWIDEQMGALKQDFLPQDHPLYTDLDSTKKTWNRFIAVQTRQSTVETQFLLSLADANPTIAGVIGWINWQDDNLEERYQSFTKQKKLKGFRHIIQAEDNGFMDNPQFIKSIALINNKFTYDILVKPHQLKEAYRLVSLFPGQRFVIDHLAKPDFKKLDLVEWKEDIQLFANNKNVYCKLSGMVTEADWSSWGKNDFNFALDTALNTFGIERLMFGSDWPVCLLASNYDGVVNIVSDYFKNHTRSAQKRIFYENAEKFYNI